jgi:HK97 family phage portal protein
LLTVFREIECRTVPIPITARRIALGLDYCPSNIQERARMPFRIFGDSQNRERKASAVGAFTALHGAGRPVWTARDSVSLARAGYQRNVIGFRCVRMIAEACASMPLRFTEGGAVLSEHPIIRLLNAPNPGQDRGALFEAIYGHLQLAGDAYVEVAGTGEAVAELHVLRPDRMRVIPGSDGWPIAYEYRVDGRAHRFEMDGASAPILHLRTFNPLDDHYGMSPMEAAAASVDVHNSAARWCKALLDNAARPSGAIVYKGVDGMGGMSDKQFRRLVEEIETNHQGAANAGRPMLLEGGLDWKPMGFSPAEMEFLETKNSAAREIALAFGVPPMLLGLPGDNTFANYQEANRAFWRQTVLPLAARATAAMSTWLGWRWGGAVKIEPDLDASPVFAAERDAHWARVAAAPFLDDDEKRSLLGLPPRATAS